MKYLWASAFLLMAIGAGHAQVQSPPIVAEVSRGAASRDNATARVNIGVNVFVTAPSGLGDQATQAHEKARRQMYEIARRECAVLLETIARECAVESLNVNIQRLQSGQAAEGFTVNSSVTYRIVPQ